METCQNSETHKKIQLNTQNKELAVNRYMHPR